MKVLFIMQGHTAHRFQVKDIQFNYYPKSMGILPTYKATCLGKYYTSTEAVKDHPDAVEFPSMVQVISHFLNERDKHDKQSWYKGLTFGERT